MAQRPGRLTVYLGAAPGVGKTFAMLDEARRRQQRGTDVIVGYVETHGRPNTVRQLEGLEIIPRRHTVHRGTELTEMDTDRVIARRPALVLVDELAHTNVPGSRHAKRVDDIEEIRAAGIDVITTVNIQHLESLNGEVEEITGVRQRETVPDEVVRTADQIQLVDMSPDALRRRLAHGNIYRPEQVDASLSSYFRVGNLTALRELALLWVADRVDDQLEDYRREHRIEQPWAARERVVVAVTGGAESETLIRRGARIAQRAAGSELIAVHVLRSDGLRVTDLDTRVATCKHLVESLGGSWHTVVGEDVAEAIVEFARGVSASMIVVGVSRHVGLRQVFTGSTGAEIARLAGAVDVHLVTHDEARQRHRWRRSVSPLSRQRQVLGWATAVLLPPLLTGLLMLATDQHNLPIEVMAFLAVVVVVALVGGLLPSLFAGLSSFLLLNWFFTEPVGRFTIAEPHNLVALIVFVAVAVAVASVVDQASRRSAEAARARAEAATLASLSQSVLTGDDTAEAIVQRLRETFGLTGVSLLARLDDGWEVLASAGTSWAAAPDDAEIKVPVDGERVLALNGRRLRASDQRVVEGFATQTGLVLEYRRLRESEARARLLERADATSTAMLRAVSHDLRTPLATMRAAVDGLLAGPGSVPEDERQELVAALDVSTEQLEHLIDDLLDLSRLSTGLLRPQIGPTSLDEVLPVALHDQDPGRVLLDLDESTPLVDTDPGLLKRVMANLVANAVRHAPADRPVRIRALAHDRETEIRIEDQGRGVPEAEWQSMFEPFQRLGDTSPGGLGLGLAVARGLSEAIGATLVPEDTPGGGLTMVLTLPRTPDQPMGPTGGGA